MARWGETRRGKGLEVELQAKLQLATADCASDVAEAGATECCAGRGTTIRRAVGAVKEKLRRVGSAKRLEAQFHVVAFREANVFGQGRVQVEKVGAAEIVAANVPEGSSGGGSKARGGEPLRAGADCVSNLHRSE